MSLIASWTSARWRLARGNVCYNLAREPTCVRPTSTDIIDPEGTLRRRVASSLLLAYAILFQPTTAVSQQVTAVGGVHYGLPLKWSALLGVGLPIGKERIAFLAGEPGIGGWRVSAGYLRMTGNLGTGFSARASLLRTTQRAWRAPADKSFGGLELQFSPLFALGVRIGAFASLRDSATRGMLAGDIGFAL